MTFTFREFHGSIDLVAAAVVEGNGGMRDGGVAGLEEGGTDAIADEGALGVNGVEVHGEVSAKSIEDGARRNGGNMGGDGSESRAEGNFLEERVGVEVGERGKGDGWGGRARTEGDGGEA